MEPLLAGLENTAIAELLRVSRWGYAAVNATHILGIGLLVGAVVPMNLRFLGLWAGVPYPPLARVLAPAAASGLVLAAAAGLLLFSVRAVEYADIGLFQAKLALVAAGTASAISLHRSYGWSLEGAGHARLRAHAIASTLCWIGALFCGRFVAFVDT